MLKGVSYKIKDGQMVISEYLDISQNENEVVYTATVLNQNQGKGVKFKLIEADNAFIFKNPVHDFPKQASYRKITDSEILVHVWKLKP